MGWKEIKVKNDEIVRQLGIQSDEKVTVIDIRMQGDTVKSLTLKSKKGIVLTEDAATIQVDTYKKSIKEGKELEWLKKMTAWQTIHTALNNENLAKIRKRFSLEKVKLNTYHLVDAGRDGKK